ncbi:MAG: 3-hydroxyacyl-CoA dehydrogenase/enoyl-CoA hydratase family protein [Legionellaceae bacterium]
MSSQEFFINQVAVLGAGVMGAQIAAQCANAGLKTYLFDLNQELSKKAIAHLQTLNPNPLATKSTALSILPCTYDDNLRELSTCDLIIEAIGERLDWKASLYERISPYLTSRTIVVTNTSGLSINVLAQMLPQAHRARFFGVHFFNPPRYMHLVELIPSSLTAPEYLDHLETWLTSRLGKGVVRAKDTPNFIANRIGVFSLLATLYHAKAFGLGLDEVDALTGPLIGRPKSATFRTMDVVGLDTLQHVVHTMQTELMDDPWQSAFVLPAWMSDLIEKGSLGQKTGQGVYRKKGKLIEVYDPIANDYRVAEGAIDDEIKAIFALPTPYEQMKALFSSSHQQAQFLAACFRDLFHYCAYHLEDIADTVRDVDSALSWGFGWKSGPFSLWQAAGVHEITASLLQAIEEGKSMSNAELPRWLIQLPDFYHQGAAYSAQSNDYKTTSLLPVYHRQQLKKELKSILYQNEGVILSSLPGDIAVLSFKSKANTIGQAVLDGLNEALTLAEHQSQGLVIYQTDASNFSSGADLRGVLTLIRSGQMTALHAMVKQFQDTLMRLKYSVLPVVAALRGRALGGGCELLMQCDGVVAAFEAYPGLVEVGVGLIPAGGGCKEFALKADQTKHAIQPYFETLAKGTVASSAADAKALGFLNHTAPVMMHAEEVLFAASAMITSMQSYNYTPPLKQTFAVAGREGHALLQAGLVNWLEGGFISQYDYMLANELAAVLCGGDVYQGQRVDEAYLLKLEREAFMRLASMPLTQDRMAYLLETGKPLRN